MDPITLAIMLGAPVAGGVLGRLFGGKDRADADQLRAKAAAQFDGINPVDLEAALREYLPQSELGKVTTDPRFQGYELDALQHMLDVSKGGGTTAQDEAGLARLRDEGNTYARQQRQQTEGDLAARGQLTGGTRVRLLASAGQNAANAANRGGYELAASREQRADQANRDVASTAAGIDNTNYQRAAAVAGANDRINQFNQGRRDQLRTQGFDQQMDLGRAKAGAYGAQANAKDSRAQDASDAWAGAGAAVGEGAAEVGKNQREKDYHLRWLRGGG